MEICGLVDGPVNAEVTSVTADEMISEAREMSEWHKNIVVKIPMIPEGMKAVRGLSKEGIRINVTLVFSAVQALIAAKAGANYVSPFIGRVDDAGQDGMDLLEEIVSVFDNYEFDDCEVLAASLRHPIHVKQAALIGADIATLPFSVFQQLFKHPLTDTGLRRFLEDWESVKGLV